MKLILQIAFGVFLGSVTAQFTMELYHNHQAELAKQQADKLKAEQEKKRQEQVNLLRNILMQNQRGNNAASPKLPDGFVPDDANPPE